jgi:Fic family protein
MHVFPNIDRLKATLDQHRPLDPAIVRNLREDLIVRWTYHSNAIEGNTLTLQETKVALEGINIGGKFIREHLEAVNHKNAILLLEDLVQKNEPLTEWTIKSLHQLILKGIDDDNAGRYRTVNVRIAGAGDLPPDQVLIAELTATKMPRRLAGSKQRTIQKSLAVNWRCASQGSTDPPRLGPSGYAHQGGCFTYGRCCP